jgi:hypothetical protein
VAFPTDLRIEWSVDHESTDPRLRQSAIVDPDDLERFLDELGEEAAATEPFIAELVKSAGARLGIGLGTPGSVLSFIVQGVRRAALFWALLLFPWVM